MRFYFIFNGAEVSQEGEKKKDYGSGIDAEIKALTKESFPTTTRSTHPTAPFGLVSLTLLTARRTSMHLFK